MRRTHDPVGGFLSQETVFKAMYNATHLGTMEGSSHANFLLFWSFVFCLLKIEGSSAANSEVLSLHKTH